MIGAALGLALALLLCALRPWMPMEAMELGLVDWRTRLFAGSRAPDPRIVIAQVLEEDVAAVKASDLAQPWPWGLDLNAAVFNLIAKAGAEAVVVDVYQFDRGTGPGEIIGGQAPNEADRQRRMLEAALADDFGAALRAVGKATLAFELSNAPVYEVPARIAVLGDRLGAQDPTAPQGLVRTGANLPVRGVLQGATALGFANVVPDRDTIVRRAPLVGRWGERVACSLALATARVVTGASTRWSAQGVSLGDTHQRTMPDGSFLVNFRSTARHVYPRIAPSKILEWAVNAARTGAPPPDAARNALEGKIVFWGVNVSGSDDTLATPLPFLTDGPVFQATVLDNLLHGDGRVLAPKRWNVALLIALGVLLGAIAGGTRHAWVGHSAALGAAVLVVAAALALFARGTAIDVFTPLLLTGLTWGGTSALRAMTAGRYNKWLEGTFGRYLAPPIIEAIKDDPSLLVLGGRRRNITVFFSDIAGFTSISRNLEAEQLVELLNQYLTESATAVLAQAGVVDKFEGDAVMAFFGDPIAHEDHALRACRAALDTIERLPKLASTLKRLGIPALHIRIGLNTGDAVVGNMGSHDRNDYTCMGDTVNLAARLESGNKAFGSTILIGPDTYAQARDHILAKPIGDVVVVGWDEPVAVYELVAMKVAASPDLVSHVSAYTQAHDAVRAGDWSAAREHLVQAQALRPGDGPTAWLQGVSDACERDAPDDPWSGHVTLTSK